MKNKLYQLISSLVMVLVTIFVIIMVINRNIMPMKYVGMLSAFVLVVIGLLILWLFKSNKLYVKVIVTFLFVIMIGCFGFGLMYQEKATSFVNKITNEAKYNTYVYSFVVLKESSDDLVNYNGYRIGTMRNFSEADDLITKEISSVIAVPYLNDYTAVDLMIKDFYYSSMKGLLLEQSYLDVVSDDYDDFIDKVKIIWTKEIRIKADDISRKVDVTSEPFILFISGIDTYGPISSLARSDVNIIMVVNPNTYEILMVHIPRDYYVEFYNRPGIKDKLTHTGAFGMDWTVKTVEEFMKIDINYYVKVNFNTLVSLVDVMGGINVYSDRSFKSGSYYFNEGYNFMNGAKALRFSRERKVFTGGSNGGDRIRGKHQEAVLDAIISKLSTPNMITKVDGILGTLGKSFVTNLSSDNITSFLNFELDKMPKWKIESISVNGSDLATLGTPFYPDTYIYVVVPDQSTIDTAKERIDKVLGKAQ